MVLRSSSYGWEGPLLSMAYEAGLSVTTAPAAPAYDRQLLNQAYRYCEAVTAIHSRSFHLASSLLPARKREATRALYAFCRVTDDIVDRPDDRAEEKLAGWRRLLNAADHDGELVAIAWSDTRARFQVPQRYAEQLIDGVARDFRQTRYQSFDELASYCYGVASTVGLMSMHIIGFNGRPAIPYAVKLGVALQLTNILRDVGEDWRAGRLYLPLDELAGFGLTESDIAAGRVTDRWRQFMRFQIERNRRLYEEAWPGIKLLARDGRFAIGAAAGLYRAILEDIEKHDYDVFNRRARVTGWGKIRRLPTLWRRSR